MRILARTPTLRFSPVVVAILALAALTPPAEHAVVRGALSVTHTSERAVERLRADAEPLVFLGGLVVSRNRHVIAGAVMGCGAGAAIGASGAGLFGLVTGGAGLAAVPPAAAIGCVIGGAGGIATGYPLDNWALEMD